MHGAVFLGIPEGEYPLATLAINLAHEIGHQILMIYQTADTLIVEDHMDLPCYSGVRKTFRPAIMTLHAAAALCHMIFACRSIIEKFPQRPFSEFMAQRTTQYQKDLSMTLQSLTKCCTFTDLGKFVVKDMLAVTDQLYQ
jgi:HEXXH motif-containing protein